MVPLGSTLVTVWRWTLTCTPLGDLDGQELVADLGDLAEDAAGRDDFVADAERGDHGLVLLRPLRLRPDQQEIEHDEDQQQRQHLQQRIRLGTRWPPARGRSRSTSPSGTPVAPRPRGHA